MMDYLKFKLTSSKLMKRFITKLVEKNIYEKFGYMVNIQINDIRLDIVDGEVNAHLDVNAKMAKPEFDRLLSNF